ncbi:hypothetical protein AUQ08_22055 [Escherichia coli]|nr:hypothetical protein AUQ08_22055 [Escherichia coli]
MYTIDFTEYMQIFRFCIPKKALPPSFTHPHDTRQPTIRYTKTDASDKRGKYAAVSTHGDFSRFTGINSHNQEYGCTRKSLIHRLRDGL